MLVKWSVKYTGSDLANCRRKVVRVLGIVADEEKIEPWVDNTHHITFFSRLSSESWDVAIVELLNVASQFSSRWDVSFGAKGIRHFSGVSNERKVEKVETLTFELLE